MQTSNALDALAEYRASAGTRERKVIDAVLDAPHLVPQLTITQLAERVGVSGSTLTRLVRKAGFKDFPEFRMQITLELERQSHVDDGLGSALELLDGKTSLDQAIQRLMRNEVHSITTTLAGLRNADLEHWADALVAAGRAVVYGFGSSAIAAADLSRKLRLLGIDATSCTTLDDAVMDLAAHRSSVLVIFSFSGESPEAINLANAARTLNRTVSSVVGRRESTLGGISDIVMHSVAEEGQIRGLGTVTRLAQCVIVDALMAAVASRDPSRITSAVFELHDAVRGVHPGRPGTPGEAV